MYFFFKELFLVIVIFRFVFYVIYMYFIIFYFCYIGDVVFFEFIVDFGGVNILWGYKFIVIAGIKDSFEIGYVILGNVFFIDLVL